MELQCGSSSLRRTYTRELGPAACHLEDAVGRAQPEPGQHLGLHFPVSVCHDPDCTCKPALPAPFRNGAHRPLGQSSRHLLRLQPLCTRCSVSGVSPIDCLLDSRRSIMRERCPGPTQGAELYTGGVGQPWGDAWEPPPVGGGHGRGQRVLPMDLVLLAGGWGTQTRGSLDLGQSSYGSWSQPPSEIWKAGTGGGLCLPAAKRHQQTSIPSA